MDSIDPTTGERIATYAAMGDEEVAEIMRRVVVAQAAWRDVPVEARAEALMRVAEVLDARAEDAAVLMAREMGKPLAEGRAEINKCAWLCRHVAEQGVGWLADEEVATEARRSYVTCQPLGVVLAVMPWNFPYWQVFRFALPALLAGNAAVLKHASNVCGCALDIEALFRDAELPEHLFRSLLIPASGVVHVLDQPGVAAVTLTGSTPAGRAVAAAAGERLLPTLLELGGSDPYLILADADLPRAAESGATSRLLNGGQSCIAAKRFVVVREVAERFEALLVEAMARRRYGPPLVDGHDLGPMARRDLRDELHAQVQLSVARGARVLLGGKSPDGPGAFYPPTVLTDVTRGSPAYEQELFGPVAAVIPVDTEREAIHVANDTPFGLGAAVFTRDVERGEMIARRHLAAGSCFVNTFVKSDPRLPFGGIKTSGYGRELAREGVRAFVNIKTIWVED